MGEVVKSFPPITTIAFMPPKGLGWGKVRVPSFAPEGDPIPLLISLGNLLITAYALYKDPDFRSATAFAVQLMVFFETVRKYEWKLGEINLTLPYFKYWSLNASGYDVCDTKSKGIFLRFISFPV